MNSLEQHIKDNKQVEVDVMNLLQDVGLVSDNAVHAAEVADADADRAVKWLEQIRKA